MTRSRTPGASACGLGVQGARPPDPTPPTPQCLFSPGTKNIPVLPPIEPKSVNDKLATVCSMLLPTYTETEVQHRLCPTVATEVENLLSVRAAGWLDQHEFEEAILQLFVNCDATAAHTPKTPSPAGCTSDGLGAQDATASARVTECLCVPSPTPPDATTCPPAPRCRQAFSAPTECSLARQVLLPCPPLDWFPAGSDRTDHRHPPDTIPAVRSLTLPDRQTSPRTIGKRPGAARTRGTGRSSQRRALPQAAPFLALTSAPTMPCANPTHPWKHPLPHRPSARET